MYDKSNIVRYDREDFDSFTHGYAISIHKSQGGEWPVIVLVISDEQKFFLTRKLIYTAVSRAKEYLFIVGSLEAFKYAISNDKETARKTDLLERLNMTFKKNE